MEKFSENSNPEVNKQVFFETNLKKYYQDFIKLALKFTRNQEDAADLFHQATENAWRKIETYNYDKYNSEVDFKKWFTTIMHNLHTDSFKGKSGHEKKATKTDLSGLEVISTSESMGGVDYDNLLLAISKTLDSESLWLFKKHYVEGYTHEAIAELANEKFPGKQFTKASVTSLLNRIKNKLRENPEIKRYYFENKS